MKRPTETFNDPAAFRAALANTRQRSVIARTNGEGDRIAALIRIAAYGFMPRWRAGAGYDFWHTDGRATAAHESYRAAVLAAERELRNA
jgi:hypothetical protein